MTNLVSHLRELLRVARCPNPACQAGTIQFAEGEICQCQWCWERGELLKSPDEPESPGDGPLFRDGDKLRLRFDSVVFTNERGGGHLVFRWRGEVVSTRDLSYHFNEGDTLTLDGFDASMQVDIE